MELFKYEKQFHAFHILKDFDFFKSYKKWRNFTVLKNYMRRTNLEETKDKIEEVKLLFDQELKKANNLVLKEN
jgi:hypothetical protein